MPAKRGQFFNRRHTVEPVHLASTMVVPGDSRSCAAHCSIGAQVRHPTPPCTIMTCARLLAAQSERCRDQKARVLLSSLDPCNARRSGVGLDMWDLARAIASGILLQSAANSSNTFWDYINGADRDTVAQGASEKNALPHKSLLVASPASPRRLAPRCLIAPRAAGLWRPFAANGPGSVSTACYCGSAYLLIPAFRTEPRIIPVYALGVALAIFYTAPPLKLKYHALGVSFPRPAPPPSRSQPRASLPPALSEAGLQQSTERGCARRCRAPAAAPPHVTAPRCAAAWVAGTCACSRPLARCSRTGRSSSSARRAPRSCGARPREPRCRSLRGREGEGGRARACAPRAVRR